MVQPEIDLLKEPLKPYLADWQAVDLKVIAVRSREGKWIYNSIRVLLDAEPVSQPIRKDAPNIEGLLVLHERWDISRIDELLASVLAGELNVGGQPVNIKSFTGSDWRLEAPRPFTFVGQDSTSRYGASFPSYVLEIQSSMGGAIDKAIGEKIDRAISVSNPPWDGIGELRENYVGIEDWRDITYEWSRLDFVAPLNVRLDSIQIDGNKVHVSISKSELTAVDKLTVSIIGTKAYDTTDRRVEKLEGNKSQDPSKLNACFNLTSGPSKLRVVLGYRGMAVDSGTVFMTGARARPSVRVLDLMGISSLQQLLAKDGEPLERGVTLLFHGLGFDTANYARGFLDSNDIVAFAGPKGPVFVIECTGGILNQRDKLAKLVQRTSEVRERVEGLEVRSVIVTSLPSKSISASNKEAARSDNIIVINADDIPKLLQMIAEGTTVEKSVRQLEGLFGSRFG